MLIEKIECAIPEYTYIGKLDDVFNTNIREDVLAKHLKDCGHSTTDIASYQLINLNTIGTSTSVDSTYALL